MRFSTLFIAVISSIGLSNAVATDSPYTPVDASTLLSDSSITKRSGSSGCGSTGPFSNGHYKWYIIASCTPGQQMTCQATDATGCVPGKSNKIGSLEVDDPNDTVQYASGKFTNTIGFTCPGGGQVRCQANFVDNNDGPNYSLRVY